MTKNVEFQLLINPEEERTFGPCSCCGNMTRRGWGYVNQGAATIAAYFVEWTPGHEEKAANFDLIVGKWGEDADSTSRKAVALDFLQSLRAGLRSGLSTPLIDRWERIPSLVKP
jgi:hypothetical protein